MNFAGTFLPKHSKEEEMEHAIFWKLFFNFICYKLINWKFPHEKRVAAEVQYDLPVL